MSTAVGDQFLSTLRSYSPGGVLNISWHWIQRINTNSSFGVDCRVSFCSLPTLSNLSVADQCFRHRWYSIYLRISCMESSPSASSLTVSKWIWFEPQPNRLIVRSHISSDASGPTLLLAQPVSLSVSYRHESVNFPLVSWHNQTLIRNLLPPRVLGQGCPIAEDSLLPPWSDGVSSRCDHLSILCIVPLPLRRLPALLTRSPTHPRRTALRALLSAAFVLTGIKLSVKSIVRR